MCNCSKPRQRNASDTNAHTRKHAHTCSHALSLTRTRTHAHTYTHAHTNTVCIKLFVCNIRFLNTFSVEITQERRRLNGAFLFAGALGDNCPGSRTTLGTASAPAYANRPLPTARRGLPPKAAKPPTPKPTTVTTGTESGDEVGGAGGVACVLAKASADNSCHVASSPFGPLPVWDLCCISLFSSQDRGLAPPRYEAHQ